MEARVEVVSHDPRNPLSAIGFAAELLRSGDDAPGEGTAFHFTLPRLGAR